MRLADYIVSDNGHCQAQNRRGQKHSRWIYVLRCRPVSSDPTCSSVNYRFRATRLAALGNLRIFVFVSELSATLPREKYAQDRAARVRAFTAEGRQSRECTWNRVRSRIPSTRHLVRMQCRD